MIKIMREKYLIKKAIRQRLKMIQTSTPTFLISSMPYL